MLKKTLCKDCLTCADFRVLFVEEIKKDVMRGNTMKKAHYRIDKVV